MEKCPHQKYPMCTECYDIEKYKELQAENRKLRAEVEKLKKDMGFIDRARQDVILQVSDLQKKLAEATCFCGPKTNLDPAAHNELTCHYARLMKPTEKPNDVSPRLCGICSKSKVVAPDNFCGSCGALLAVPPLTVDNVLKASEKRNDERPDPLPIQHSVKYCPCADCSSRRACPGRYTTAHNARLSCSKSSGHSDMHEAIIDGFRYEWSGGLEGR